MSGFRDITGQKFNMLTVLKLDHKKDGRFFWKCRCDCGNEKVINGDNIKYGKSRSCGCIARELSSKRIKELGIAGGGKLERGKSSFNILYKRYQRQAKKKGRSFSLTEEEFFVLTKSNCCYCGIEPRQVIEGERSNGEYVFNGIDREDNDFGYEHWNCVSCCGKCNKAKGQSSLEDFEKWIDNLVKFKLRNNNNMDLYEY